MTDTIQLLISLTKETRDEMAAMRWEMADVRTGLTALAQALEGHRTDIDRLRSLDGDVIARLSAIERECARRGEAMQSVRSEVRSARWPWPLIVALGVAGLGAVGAVIAALVG